MATNNSFNLPLEDGEIIIGSTGNTPVASSVMGAVGGSITVILGAGSISLAHMPLTTLAVDTDLVANNSYSIFDNLGLITFTFPNLTAKKGDTYEIYACGVSGVGFRVNTSGGQLIFGPAPISSPQNNIQFVVPGEASSVRIRCINDTVVNSEHFQVVSFTGTPSTGV